GYRRRRGQGHRVLPGADSLQSRSTACGVAARRLSAPCRHLCIPQRRPATAYGCRPVRAGEDRETRTAARALAGHPDPRHALVPATTTRRRHASRRSSRHGPVRRSEGMNDAAHAGDHRASALRVFAIEAEAVGNLANLIDDDFSRAVEQILQSRGRTIVCGMGKSGIIGRKIAATMASTGTPSFFMHPGEAYHGDLGMVTSDDTFIAISFSGETDEVLKLLPFLKDNGNFIVAITGNPESTLATAADCHLNVRVDEEACPLRLAPTSSTTATLAMGDAMAVTLMEARGFRPENFARFHPGGSLGRRLLSRVEH